MIKTDSPLTVKKEVKLVSPYIKIPENIGLIDFDTLHINENFIQLINFLGRHASRKSFISKFF